MSMCTGAFFKHGFDKSLNNGQFVFMEKDQKPIGERMYTILNLPSINFLLSLAYSKKRMDDKGWDTNTQLNDIVVKYIPYAVINNEVGGENEPQERLLNCTVSGRSRTFNIWGNNCFDGTPLFFILKNIFPPWVLY